MPYQRFAILFWAFALTSCSQHSIVGAYQHSGLGAYHRLDLNSNGSFTYLFEGGVGNTVTTKGSWKMEQKRLFLKSDDQYLPFQVQESNDEKDRLLISLKDREGLSYIRECVRLDRDTNCYETLNDGIVEIAPWKKVDTIHIFSVFDFYHYPVKNRLANVFHIVFDNSSQWYVKDTFHILSTRKLQSNSRIFKRMSSKKAKKQTT